VKKPRENSLKRHQEDEDRVKEEEDRVEEEERVHNPKCNGVKFSSSSAIPRCSSDESDSACCPACKLSEDAVWLWVACDTCKTWYHAECTELDPDVYPDLDIIDWVCTQSL